MADTVRVRGSGGFEFDLDLPPVGSRRREIIDSQFESGDLSLIEPEPAAKPAKAAAKKPQQ